MDEQWVALCYCGYIQRETWVVGLYAGADYKLTLSHCRIRSEIPHSATTSVHYKGKGLGGKGLSYWLGTFASVCNNQ
jgi:hypothetical protein